MKMLDNCICGGLSDAQGSLEQLHRNRMFLVSATIERPGQFLVAQSWRKDAALCKAAFSDSYVVVPAEGGSTRARWRTVLLSEESRFFPVTC